MPYYNALNKPFPTNHQSRNRTRLTWNPVSGSWNGSIYYPDYYRVYEGGYMSFTCSACSASYTSSTGSHPEVCTHCGYSGPDWDWHQHAETITNVSGTEYTVKNLAGWRSIWIAACHSGNIWDGDPELWSEPQHQYAIASGSYIDSVASVSLQRVGMMVMDGVEYQGSVGTVSLNETTYNGNLNPFSRKLPGDSQYSLLRHMESAYDFNTKVVAPASPYSWYISGSDNRQFEKSASLKSFRGYTDSYECGVTNNGYYYYFPWGELAFYDSNTGMVIPMHPSLGIVSSSAISGSFSMYIKGKQSRYTYDNDTLNLHYAKRLIDSGWEVDNGGSITNYGKFSNKSYIYPGVVLIHPYSYGFNCYLSTSSLSSLGLDNYNDKFVLSTTFPALPAGQTSWSGSRMYPVLVAAIGLDPITGSLGAWGGWKSKTGTTALATQIFTCHDNYLPISVN